MVIVTILVVKFCTKILCTDTYMCTINCHVCYNWLYIDIFVCVCAHPWCVCMCVHTCAVCTSFNCKETIIQGIEFAFDINTFILMVYSFKDRRKKEMFFNKFVV